MDFIIRTIKTKEYELLKDFIYEAIFIPEGIDAPDKAIINNPDLKVYYENFGDQKDDYGLVAVVNDKIVGATWSRIMNDYGHIDDDTPSLAISLYQEYRGNGIGTALLSTLITDLKGKGYKRLSLAVQKDNYAFKMYKDLGFEIIDENKEEYIMINYLSIL